MRILPTGVCPQVDINCFAGRQLEDFIDVAHFVWVHSATLGFSNDVEVHDYTIKETDHGFSTDYLSGAGRYPIGRDQRGQEYINGLDILKSVYPLLPHSPFIFRMTPNKSL